MVMWKRSLWRTLAVAVFLVTAFSQCLGVQLAEAPVTVNLAALLNGKLAQEIDSAVGEEGLLVHRLGMFGSDVLPDLAVGMPRYKCHGGERDCGAVVVMLLGMGPDARQPVVVQKAVQLRPDAPGSPFPVEEGAEFGYTMAYIGELDQDPSTDEYAIGMPGWGRGRLALVGLSDTVEVAHCTIVGSDYNIETDASEHLNGGDRMGSAVVALPPRGSDAAELVVGAPHHEDGRGWVGHFGVAWDGNILHFTRLHFFMDNEEDVLSGMLPESFLAGESLTATRGSLFCPDCAVVFVSAPGAASYQGGVFAIDYDGEQRPRSVQFLEAGGPWEDAAFDSGKLRVSDVAPDLDGDGLPELLLHCPGGDDGDGAFLVAGLMGGAGRKPAVRLDGSEDSYLRLGARFGSAAFLSANGASIQNGEHRQPLIAWGSIEPAQVAFGVLDVPAAEEWLPYSLALSNRPDVIRASNEVFELNIDAEAGEVPPGALGGLSLAIVRGLCHGDFAGRPDAFLLATGIPGDSSENHGRVLVRYIDDRNLVPMSSPGGYLLRGEEFVPRTSFFGHDVASIGDVDLDGVPDLLVGAPESSMAFDHYAGDPRYRGLVTIFYLRPDGRVDQPFTHSGPENEGFGSGVTGIGDIDRDGCPDVAIGAFLHAGGEGAVFVFLLRPDRDSPFGDNAVLVPGGNLPTLESMTGIGEDRQGWFGEGVAHVQAHLFEPDLTTIAVSAPRSNGNLGSIIFLGIDPKLTLQDLFSVTSGTRDLYGTTLTFQEESLCTLRAAAGTFPATARTPSGTFPQLVQLPIQCRTEAFMLTVGGQRADGQPPLMRFDTLGRERGGLGSESFYEKPTLAFAGNFTQAMRSGHPAVIMGLPYGGVDEKGVVHFVEYHPLPEALPWTQRTPNHHALVPTQRCSIEAAHFESHDDPVMAELRSNYAQSKNLGRAMLPFDALCDGTAEVFLGIPGARMVHGACSGGVGSYGGLVLGTLPPTVAPLAAFTHEDRLGTMPAAALYCSEEHQNCGAALALLGDVDGDGLPELAVGCSGKEYSGTGEAILISRVLFDGQLELLHSINRNDDALPNGVIGSSHGESGFGMALAGLQEDLNEDGVVDFVAGVPFAHDTDGGMVLTMFLHASGRLDSFAALELGSGGIPILSSGAHLGHSLVALGDVTGDGLRNGIAIAAPKAQPPVVLLGLMLPNGHFEERFQISMGTTCTDGPGFDFSLVLPKAGEPSVHGGGVAPDLNGDGVPDLLLADINGPSLEGATSHGTAAIVFLNSDFSVRSFEAIRPQHPQFLGASVLGQLDPSEGNTQWGHLAVLGLDGAQAGLSMYAGAWGHNAPDASSSGGLVRFTWVPPPSYAGGGVAAWTSMETEHAACVLQDGQELNPTLDPALSGLGAFSGGGAGETFGSSMAPLNDIDHNGVVDIAVGSALAIHESVQAGAVTILLMRDDFSVKSALRVDGNLGEWAALHENHALGHCGFSMAWAGDISNDGYGEIVVGCPSDLGMSGGAAIISLGYGAVVSSITPIDVGDVLAPELISYEDETYQARERLGHSVAVLNDGWLHGHQAVIAIGAPLTNAPGHAQIGAVILVVVNKDSMGFEHVAFIGVGCDNCEFPETDNLRLGSSVAAPGVIEDGGRTDTLIISHNSPDVETSVFVVKLTGDLEHRQPVAASSTIANSAQPIDAAYPGKWLDWESLRVPDEDFGFVGSNMVLNTRPTEQANNLWLGSAANSNGGQGSLYVVVADTGEDPLARLRRFHHIPQGYGAFDAIFDPTATTLGRPVLLGDINADGMMDIAFGSPFLDCDPHADENSDPDTHKIANTNKDSNAVEDPDVIDDQHGHAYHDGDAHTHDHTNKDPDVIDDQHGHAYVQRDPDAHTHSDTDKDADRHAYVQRDPDAHTHSDTNKDADRHAYVQRDPDAHTHSDTNKDADRHAYVQRDPDAHTHSHTDKDPDVIDDQHGHAYVQRDPDAHTHSDTNQDPDVIDDQHGHAYVQRDPDAHTHDHTNKDPDVIDDQHGHAYVQRDRDALQHPDVICDQHRHTHDQHDRDALQHPDVICDQHGYAHCECHWHCNCNSVWHVHCRCDRHAQQVSRRHSFVHSVTVGHILRDAFCHLHCQRHSDCHQQRVADRHGHSNGLSNGHQQCHAVSDEHRDGDKHCVWDSYSVCDCDVICDQHGHAHDQHDRDALQHPDVIDDQHRHTHNQHDRDALQHPDVICDQHRHTHDQHDGDALQHADVICDQHRHTHDQHDGDALQHADVICDQHRHTHCECHWHCNCNSVWHVHCRCDAVFEQVSRCHSLVHSVTVGHILRDALCHLHCQRHSDCHQQRVADRHGHSNGLSNGHQQCHAVSDEHRDGDKHCVWDSYSVCDCDVICDQHGHAFRDANRYRDCNSVWHVHRRCDAVFEQVSRCHSRRHNVADCNVHAVTLPDSDTQFNCDPDAFELGLEHTDADKLSHVHSDDFVHDESNALSNKLRNCLGDSDSHWDTIPDKLAFSFEVLGSNRGPHDFSDFDGQSNCNWNCLAHSDRDSVQHCFRHCHAVSHANGHSICERDAVCEWSGDAVPDTDCFAVCIQHKYQHWIAFPLGDHGTHDKRDGHFVEYIVGNAVSINNLDSEPFANGFRHRIVFGLTFQQRGRNQPYSHSKCEHDPIRHRKPHTSREPFVGCDMDLVGEQGPSVWLLEAVPGTLAPVSLRVLRDRAAWRLISFTVRLGSHADGWIAQVNRQQASSHPAALQAAAVGSGTWSGEDAVALSSAANRYPSSLEGSPKVAFIGARQSGRISTNSSILSQELVLNVSLPMGADYTPSVHLFDLQLLRHTTGEVRAAVSLGIVVEVPELEVAPQSIQELVKPHVDGGSTSTETSITLRNPGNSPLNWELNLPTQPCWLTPILGSGVQACGAGSPAGSCARGMIAPGASQVVKLRIVGSALRAGQHNTFAELTSNAGDMHIPIKVVVTTLSVCPSRLVLGDVHPPANMDPASGFVRHTVPVSLANVGEAPVRVAGLVPILAEASSVAAALSTSLVSCGAASGTSDISQEVLQLQATHGAPDWLSAVAGASQPTFQLIKSAADAGRAEVMPSADTIAVGADGTMYVTVELGAHTSLGADLGRHVSSVVVLLQDTIRNSTEARAVEVEVTTVPGPVSEATSTMQVLATRLDATERSLESGSSGPATTDRASRVALVALRDALGHARPAGSDTVQPLLAPQSLDTLTAPACAAASSPAWESAAGQVVTHELEGARALEVLQSAQVRDDQKAALQAHVSRGGSLLSVHAVAQTSAALPLVLRAVSLPVAQLTSNVANVQSTLGGASTCQGEVGFAQSGRVDAGQLSALPAQLLVPTPALDSSAPGRMLSSSPFITQVSTTGASCSGDGLVLDPATNLTCTCQPGFALSPALRGSPFTSTSLQCVPCPAGTSRRGPTLRFGDEPGACFPCATGTFSLEGWHNCAPCPANMQCTNGMVFVTSGHAFLNDQEAVDFATDLSPTYSGIGAGSGMPGTPDLFKADTPEEAPQPAQSSIATTCPNPFACIQDGSVNTSESTSVLLQTKCAVGHDPDSLLCAGCLAGYEHNPPAAGSAGDCRACPPTTTAASKVALLSLIAASLYVLVLVAWFHPKLGPGVLPPALLVTPVADSLEAVRRSWCGCCSSPGPARAKRGVPALSRRRPSAFSKPNPMERRAKGGSTAAETLPEGTELSLHPVAPGLLWTVSAPHLPIAERERSASMFALVKRVLPWDLPKWVLSWDSTNREAPTGAFHSLYNSMIATGRREMPVPVLFSAPPAMDTALRAFGGLALLMFLQFSARLSDTRLGADTQGESTSAVPHMASVFPVSAVEASCLVQSVVGGYSRFVLGAGLMLGTIPLAFGLALIAYTLLACVRASSRSHAIVTGSRSAAVTSGGPTKSAAPLAGASLDSVVGAWSVALASPQPAAFSHVFIAALVILIPTLVPAGISVIGAAVFATAPNGSGGHNLLSDFSVEAGTGEHAMFVLIAIGLGSLTAGLPLALALYSRQSCDAAMRSVARKTATLVGGAASIMGPLPNPSRLPRVGACSGHFSFAGLSWRVGGLLWGWHRPSAWWWQLWLFAAACCLALLPGVLANAWSRLYVANVITIVMWLVFEWRKPYAVHRLIGAPSALFPRAPRLALPPHLLYADRERKSSLPAITATGIFAGVHAAGQRAGRAVLSIEARLRTRLMRFLLFMLVVQASVAHMAYVWHASLFVGEGGSSDTAEATGSPSDRLQEALEGINASRTLRAAILGLSWVQWGAMWLGIAACVVFLLPSLLRGVVLAVLGNASWLLSSAVDASLKLCDKHRAQSTAKPLSRRWGDSQRIIVPKGGKGRKATKKTGPAKAKTSKAVGDAATPAMKWGAGSAGEDTDISFSNPMLSKGVSKAKAQREHRASHGSRVLTAALTQGVNPMLQHSNRSRPSPVRLRALSRAGIYTASPKLKVLKSRASSRAARRVESEEKGDAQAAKRAASPATLEELRAASPGTVASQAYFNNPIRQPQVMTRISHKPSRRTSVAASKMRLPGAGARSSVFAGANPIRAPAETPPDVAGLLRSARTDARATLASALEAGQHPRLAARRRLPAGSASGDRAVARARGLRAGSPSARKTSSKRARSRQRALQL